MNKNLELQKSNGAVQGVVVIPTLAELIADTEETRAQDSLTVILNQSPPTQWLAEHPTAKIKNAEGKQVPLPYLPINKIEYLLTKIFKRWWTEVRLVQCIANSVCVTVRLYVVNPITGKEEWQDGVGAAAIQTDSGKGAMDWNYAKSHGVQIALPAAESYAIKDAAEKFGKIFGKDLGRKDSMDYNVLLPRPSIGHDDLSELLELKKEALTKAQLKDAERILNGKETASYKKLHTLLMSK